MQQEAGIVPRLLAKVGAPASQFESELGLDRLPAAEGGAEPQPSRSLRAVLDQAQKLAPQFQDQYVSVEHLLMAIVSEPDSGAARAFRCTENQGVAADRHPGAARFTPRD